MKNNLFIGIDGNKNRINQEEELPLNIPNSQNLVVSSIDYILNNTKDFLEWVTKMAKTKNEA